MRLGGNLAWNRVEGGGNKKKKKLKHEEDLEKAKEDKDILERTEVESTKDEVA